MDGTVFRTIEDYLVESNYLDRYMICEKTTLDDTGMDSLELIEFVMELEKRLGVVVAEETIDSWNRKTTLGEICRDLIYG